MHRLKTRNRAARSLRGAQKYGSGKCEAQQIAGEKLRLLPMSREPSIPPVPVRRNQPRLWRGMMLPSGCGLFA